MKTFNCTVDEYMQASKEFFLELPHMSNDQIDNGLKCLGLMYIGLELDLDKDNHLLYKCAMVYKLSVRHAIINSAKLQELTDGISQ